MDRVGTKPIKILVQRMNEWAHYTQNHNNGKKTKQNI